MKPEESAEESEPTLSLDDPDFQNKLHDKYFPDLPRDVEKLKWMRQLPETEPADTVIQDVSQCRFDFDGNLVPPTREIKSTTHSALHHHADDPQLAGYTIPELQRLSRSTFAAQRAIALQTLGRVLYKLGKQSYYQLVPEVDSETYQEEGSVQAVTNKIYAMFWDLCKDCRIIRAIALQTLGRVLYKLGKQSYYQLVPEVDSETYQEEGSVQAVTNKIYAMFWDLCKDCRIIDCLQDAADETKTRHLSVRNYALEALWLWKGLRNVSRGG
ncbi:uncharacterized protein ZBAI_01616 [Zygosaccharomyces bailii ISA1307]|nr:uncharacterized protein ZBAI_01616 [Zygosaccharomyces bailii ISA1307]